VGGAQHKKPSHKERIFIITMTPFTAHSPMIMPVKDKNPAQSLPIHSQSVTKATTNSIMLCT